MNHCLNYKLRVTCSVPLVNEEQDERTPSKEEVKAVNLHLSTARKTRTILRQTTGSLSKGCDLSTRPKLWGETTWDQERSFGG